MTSEPTLFDELDEETGALSPSARPDLQTSAGLLALMVLPGIGPGRAIKLATSLKWVDAFNDSGPELRRRAAGVSVDGTVSVREPHVPSDAHLLSYFDDDYPASLRTIPNPPAVLWVRGSLPDPARRIAIVGTRSATSWGAAMATSIGGICADADVGVVSGLALGVDIAAHRGALERGGHTIAILGSGIDQVTPREHLSEATTILEAGGCLLSEVPPGTPPSARTLVARNRLQSGLSHATIVVQCGTKSGTMTTARFALEQGRVLAIPLPPETEVSHPENLGSLTLLRESKPVTELGSRDDLSELLAAIS